MRISLSVKNQSVETSGITKDYKEAICEYIWNGFEANADTVSVNYCVNELERINEISITDNGTGIIYDDIKETFGAFLASKKNSLSLQIKSKANKGKGRFSFTAFASDAVWDTVYFDEKENCNKKYTIYLSNNSKEFVDCTDPSITSEPTGTTVKLLNVFNVESGSFAPKVVNDFLLPVFAWYLHLNPTKKLIINNNELDYSQYINTELSEKRTFNNIYGHNFTVDLVVWNSKINEKFCCYFLTDDNILKDKDTTTYNRNTVDFNHSVFVKSKFFTNWNSHIQDEDDNQVSFDAPDNGRKVLSELRKQIQHFISEKIDSYMSQKADEEVEKMINERKTFPKFSDDIYDQHRKKDLSNVTKALYQTEPKIFYKLKDVQEKSLLAFLNLLLITDEREQILDIVDEIVRLSPEQRAQFKDILHKTSLENIIETIGFIEERYKVIETLKTLIYDLTSFTNERDHIQKIIEQNYWIFGEKYNLASADKTMTKALENYINILYGAKSPDVALTPDEESNRRMDLFLCASRKTENSFETTIQENIVVELKAPKVALSKTVLRQIEDYMDYIRKHSPFNGESRRWKFIAVCKEVDDDVKSRCETFKDRGKVGLVQVNNNYEIYALTWDDVFNAFEISHSFYLEKLKLNRDEIIKEISEKAENASRETVNEITNDILQ